MNETEYRVYERRMMAQRIKEIENQSLADKKEAAADFEQIITAAPHTIIERISWILGGSYGWAEAEAAHRILAGSRNNKRAALLRMVAIHEWGCATYWITKIWKSLPKQGQQAINEMIDEEIAEYVREHPNWRTEWGM